MQSAIASCRSCRARLRASPLSAKAWSPLRRYSDATTHTGRPLRMAVIGSGPAGFYTAYRVMAKTEARVDMYEALPVPFGLVRFGVAPDHPEVKNCQDKFAEVAQAPGFSFVGNVAVGAAHHAGGGHVPLDVLARHYDAVVFAYGASRDRRLGVPGEELQGVHAARDFVGWYNGLPGVPDTQLAADLARAETAVVVGQGNVALDVARMLLEDVDVLRSTDMSEAALAALAESRVRRVHVVGRRGPMQAAFTIKEIRELVKLRDVGLHDWDRSLAPPSLKDLPRAQRRLMEVVCQGSPTPAADARKLWSLDFCLAPRAFSEADSGTGRVGVATMEHTRLVAPFDRATAVEGTGQLVDVPTQLVFRSIGYRAEAIPGMAELGIPFDDGRGVVLNDGRGRVLRDVRAPDASMGTAPHPGFYCAGWVKRGPTGVIASTMEDAFVTADAIVHDWGAQVPFLGSRDERRHGWEGVQADADTTGARVVSWSDWQRIDQAEVEAGQRVGKPRQKLTTTDAMLGVV